MSAPRLWTMHGPGIAAEKRRDRATLEAAANRASFHILFSFCLYVENRLRSELNFVEKNQNTSITMLMLLTFSLNERDFPEKIKL